MNKKEIKILDREISTRAKAFGRCEVCHTVPGQLHPHHYISRRTRSTRWAWSGGGGNIIVLCPKCHFMFHQHPIKARDKCKLIRPAWWESQLRELSNKLARSVTYEEHHDMVDWNLHKMILWYDDRKTT